MTLLTIAVPTYNRPKELKLLNDNFLAKIALTHQGGIEVLVCDNSDEHTASENRNNLCEQIKYHKNMHNLGYSKNIVHCLERSQSEWIWIISDDDDVDIDAFSEMFVWLKEASLSSYSAIMLPFNHMSYNDKSLLVNTAEEWGWEDGQNLAELVKNKNNIPFVLFSSVVVRNPNFEEHHGLKVIINKYNKNNFIQILLFFEIISTEGKLIFYSSALQKYRPPSFVRFSLTDSVKSMEEVLEYVSYSLDIPIERLKNSHYRRWMRWIFAHKAGIIQVEGADQALYQLLWKWRYQHFCSFKDLLIAIVCLSPASIVKVINGWKEIFKKYYHGI
jgi:glycosyltransferase involved in cell wall biosynthesis